MAVITREENELLTQTGPGTPMGRLFREYWLPAMLSERLPEPDGAPIRIKLLSEKLVAFRATDGKVGLMDEFCPHRRVSLVYGRNEECGLRCAYHGWKFDVNGLVLETPAEPNPEFGKSIRHRAYPTREAGGIIWTYMGERAVPPPFPDFLFTKLPANRVIGFHYNTACNYLQGIEADLDLSHPSFLHSALGPVIDKAREAMGHDPRPRGFTRDEPFGMQTIWTWKLADPTKELFWIDPFVVPCYTIVPGGRTTLRYTWHAWVPIDDENHYLYYVHFDPEIDPPANERQRLGEVFGHDLIDPNDEYRASANLANLHLLDRKRQKNENFSGIRGIAMQDVAITQSMGPIIDRSLERLGAKDTLVVALRRYMLNFVRKYMAGGEIPGIKGEISYPDIDTRMVIVPNGTHYTEVLDRREWRWGDIAAE